MTLAPVASPFRTTRYEIRDAAGDLVAVHCRVDNRDGKQMWWEQPDGTKGLGGLPLADLPLYGIERLDGRSIVVVCEGEKAAAALHRSGHPRRGHSHGRRRHAWPRCPG